MPASREQFIQATCSLLESQGYHATGLNQIVREAGAPKGSLYYYFPEGKEELAEIAIRQATAQVVERIRASLAGDDGIAPKLNAFVLRVAQAVEESGYQSGGPLTTVALETATTSPRLNQVCRAAYEEMRRAFEDSLLSGGVVAENAQGLSMVILSTIEGAILLSRTYHSGSPLHQAADALAFLVETCCKNG